MDEFLSLVQCTCQDREGEMLGILILGVCLMFGLWSYLGISIRHRFGCPTNRQEETPNGQQAAEETSPPSEAEPEASASEFQVFLSFYGPDSRQGLADVLYDQMTSAGIRVFRDNDALEPGDRIDKTLSAIDNSKICVPIFSKSFASSDWCLREVERMVELKKGIMPIFYTATPDDVKLRTDLFKKDLKKNEKKHGREQVKKWGDALSAVGKIIGREVKTTGFEEFSTSFVKALLIKLRIKRKQMTDRLVRRHDHEEAVMRLLDTDSEGVRLVGIYGMGGAGKTTLAKVVFNNLSHQFDCCSFLDNFQESLRRHDGLEYLLNQLLGDLNPKLKNIENINPIRTLQETFRNSKVLVVLDNVKERREIEMITGYSFPFGSGSRIIVTTRDKRVFTREDWAVEVEVMNEEQALQLFSKHAFGEDAPPVDYRVLSNEVLSFTGNLPLAIEVIGSSLHQREKMLWRATINKLKKSPNEVVKEKLKRSFDALGEEEQQIFLDIACFFINEDISTATYLWEACDYDPILRIDVLVSLSLVKIIDRNIFWMHDLIRDLGRELAKGSRIWTPEEADKVLRMKQGKENVQGLYQERRHRNELTHVDFSGFDNLRLLKLVDVKMIGDFKDLLPELKWFSWNRCPLDFTAINLCLRNLVVLELSRSFITERWTGWSIIKMAKDLKVLDLTECVNLRGSPDLSSNTSLERLCFRDCRCLLELDSSIGMLKGLKHLDLKGCHSLRGLPESIGSLEDLEELLVDGSGNTFHLPNTIGNLRSLSVIKLHRVEITRIPDTISGLVSLTRLSLFNCTGMAMLPQAIGDLISLESLDLSNTKITICPDSIGNLVKLTELDVSGTEIATLPDSIGNLVKLEKLQLSHTKMTALPDSIGNLVKITKLNLSGTEMVVLPDFIGNLVELTTLDLSATKMTALPDCIGNLVKLEMLDVSDTEMTTLPDSIGNLVKLEKLDLSETIISSLPDSIGNLVELTELDLSQTKIVALPICIGNLIKLTKLNLSETGMVVLPDSIGKLDKLTQLDLSGTKMAALLESN